MLIDSSTSSCIQRRAVEGASIWDQCNGYRNDFISEQKAAPVCLFGMQGAATWKTVLKIGPAGTHTQRSIIYHIDELPVSRLELGNREGDSSIRHAPSPLRERYEILAIQAISRHGRDPRLPSRTFAGIACSNAIFSSSKTLCCVRLWSALTFVTLLPLHLAHSPCTSWNTKLLLGRLACSQ